MLISDNQNQDDCGCYGNTIVKTPNLDALARRGVRFTDAFATASCGPSRAVIYSGSQTLDLLQATNRVDETLVIFTSDHGSSEPGAMSNHYEPGIRVPLIVRDPTANEVGTTSPALVTLADITPTILDWAGVAGPAYPLHGRSLLPILLDDQPAGWDEVFLSHVCHEVTMYYPMRTIRNRRFKLIWNINWRSEYPLPIDTLRRATWTETVRRGDRMIGKRSVRKFLFRDQIELYDLENDPDEIRNLAADPRYQQVRKELSAKLVAWLEETDDPWLVRHRLPMPGETESVSSRQANLEIQMPAKDRQ